MTPPRAAAALLAALLLWTGAQAAWLGADHRITEGDVVSNTGALELFHEEAGRSGLPTVLRRSWTEDFGEYPTLAPALQGWAARRLGVRDVGGDGPPLEGLLWAWLLVIASVAAARRVSPGSEAWTAALLLLSPFVAGLARHVLLEVPMAAAIALTAALGLRAAAGDRPGWGAWIACGAAAGAALLCKQTAILALAPLALLGWRRRRGVLVAAATAAAVAGPWYLRRLGAESDYLWRSAEANPDAVGALHQLAIYPLALLQLPWGPWGVLAFVIGGLAVRQHPGRRDLLVALAVGLIPLLLVPKKYPRLLLPLLPLIAIWLGAWLNRWPRRAQGLLFAGLLGAQIAAFTGALTPSMLGLTGLDERCAQRWIRGPHREGVDWAGILAAVETHGGRSEETRVGAVRWPVPPCTHQTTLDLGEHLRIAARRAGLEATIEAGASYEQNGGWPGGDPPELILSDGPLPDCPGCGPLELVGAWPLTDPGWSADLRLYRRAR